MDVMEHFLRYFTECDEEEPGDNDGNGTSLAGRCTS